MIKKLSLGFAAAAALMAAQPAQAQNMSFLDANGEPLEMGPALLYVSPFAISAVRNVCANELSADGFFATEGDVLEARYAAAAEGTWPEAKSLLVQMGMSRDEGSADVLGALPDDALRPFVDAIIPTMIASEIKPESCNDIENVVELLAPLPPENMGRLFDVILQIMERENQAKKQQASGFVEDAE